MHAVIASTHCQIPTPSAMLLLLLLVLPLSLGEEQTKPALHEDFNVLVYGTLQLGQALRDTYSSTNGKLEKIGGRQEKLGKRIEGLQTEVSRARYEMGRIGEEVEALQREEHERRDLSHRMADNLRDTREEYTALQRRVQDLEKGAQAKEQLLPSFLKKRLEKQDLILQVITEETARQKKVMAEQSERLLTILKQVSAMGSS